jgi:hypothetical protein
MIESLVAGNSKIIVCAPMLQFFVPVHQYREPTSVSDAKSENRIDELDYEYMCKGFFLGAKSRWFVSLVGHQQAMWVWFLPVV